MPTYEYVCRSCAHQFEIVQSFVDAALSECPQCKGSLRKVFGNVGITFKGTGFYKNDSRGSGTKSEPSTTAGSSTPSTATSDSSTSSSTSSTSSTSTSDSAPSSAAPSTPASSDSGSSHGHSHGPGTHTH